MKILKPTWALASPRQWQASAFDAIRTHLADENPRACVVQAVMGSGKSLLVAEVVAKAGTRGRIVITTSTMALVEQLGQTISTRLAAEGRKDEVGLFYTHAKQADRPIIVACTPSAETLVKALREHDAECAFWLADECHRTEG